MSGWRRCDSCRKVKPATDFDGEATTCQACLTTPTPAPRKRSSGVVTTRKAPAPAAAPAERGPRLGSVGSGDLEVRERRARRAAHDAMAELASGMATPTNVRSQSNARRDLLAVNVYAAHGLLSRSTSALQQP